MELKDILQINVKSLQVDRKKIVFDFISNVEIDSVPKKHVKKTFEIAQQLMKLKEEEVEKLRSDAKNSDEIDTEEPSEIKLLEEENVKLRKSISKLEGDKAALKTRIRDLIEDMSLLRKRLQESNASDKDDSSDLLSDIDRKEELLKNINSKNKHIKRLLRDIETLEKSTIEQTKIISSQEDKLSTFEFELSQIKDKYTTVNDDNANLSELLTNANEEIEKLEKGIFELEADRERTDAEFKIFLDKLEEKAYTWRNILDDKEQQLESMRKKYEEIYLKYPHEKVNDEQETEYKRLVEAMQDRDAMIEELEGKLRVMAEEMMSSTKLMNQISQDRDLVGTKIAQKSRHGYGEIEMALEQANKRCRELSELLDNVEEDNMLKSKQAADAISALQAYENGDESLTHSLQKVRHLEQKLGSRDKQIKALVMEINSMHEIAQENLILRKKLNLPDDAVISTNNLAAKQKSKDKLIDRLTLKLRASEEMRLNLKLEMNELRKDLNHLKSCPPKTNLIGPDSFLEPQVIAIKPSFHMEPIYCTNCLKTLKKLPDKDIIIQEINAEWETKYSGVIEENENLRVGMHEILERIREYDASSDHISIDCTILEKLLHALDARSVSGWYHPAMRMQNELIALKEREQRLKEQIVIAEKTTVSTEDTKNDVIDGLNGKNDSILSEGEKPEDKFPDKSQQLYPIIVQKDLQYDTLRDQFLDVSNRYRDVLLENEKLRCFEALYEEIRVQLESSDNQLTQYCAVLVDKISIADTKLHQSEKKYSFLKQDFERSVVELNTLKLSSTAVIAELKKQIIDKRMTIMEREEGREEKEKKDAENETFKAECASLRMQLACITRDILTDAIDKKHSNGELVSFTKYGIVEDDFTLDFITSQEYNHLKLECAGLTKSNLDLSEQCKHLQKLLVVSEEQIKSQQRQLTDLTDNQVNLRHLVADLQSTNEEKFIISKAFRDAELAREELNRIKGVNQELENRCNDLQKEVKFIREQNESLVKKEQEINSNDSIKIQFLKKSLYILQGKYCKYTPLVSLTDFLTAYKSLVSNGKSKEVAKENIESITEDIISKLKIDNTRSDTDNMIKVIKFEAKCRFLEEQVDSLNEKVSQSQQEIDRLKLSIADDGEHWKTINALFSNCDDVNSVTYDDKSIQCSTETSDISTETDTIEESQKSPMKISKDDVKSTNTVVVSCPSSPNMQISNLINVRSLESQLKQAMQLASMRNALLLETENKLAESLGRVKEMEKIIEEKNTLLKQSAEKNSAKEDIVSPRRSSLVESTISSLQALLTEKDTTLHHYQELLKTEREQHAKSCENFDRELDAVQKKCHELEAKVKTKSTEIMELTSKLDILDKKASSASQLNTELDEIKQLEDSDNNFNEISDEKIEEMFLDDNKQLSRELLQGSINVNLEESEQHMNRYIKQLQSQLNEAKDRAKFWEESAKAKDDEIEILKEKLALLEEKEKLDVKSSPEIEQLQTLLEEKDRHINDLMDTLSSFHDDQQCLINETTLYSADQVTLLGVDLTRSESTNRILSTQLEALRRQVSSLTQREKQARELINSLRNQLIKRPVVSVKTELNTRTKYEQLQKRMLLMETELEDLRREKQRLTTLVEEKRAKNANDLALWDKQKRWQQSAEKLKTKLAETEASLEKNKIMLNTAKTTINRLEKDKHILESRLRGTVPEKCCRTPSCPNLLLTKYYPSETPETCTTGSECNSPARREDTRSVKYVAVNDSNTDIINALKARIESQQRRIVSLELERKGSNALTTELEKCQEKLASIEAQNIRLEAKNLQLQLDIDLMKQGDEKDRSQKRIKYLEDYVLALKEELAQAEAQKEMSGSQVKFSGTNLSHPEQTILSLRRIVERLRIDNKNLKEARGVYDGKAVDIRGGGDLVQELKSVKDKLQQKTQLLEKAKILLTRAAAKEKNLKEQLTIWKRKCSELQNVPVIDEISE